MRHWMLAVLVVAAPAARPAIAQPVAVPDAAHRLAALCQVWGFLKYHHPNVGDRADWDEVLLSAIPRFAAAETRTAFDAEVLGLIREANPTYGAREAQVVRVTPPPQGGIFRWIDDPTGVAPAASRWLRIIRDGRQAPANRYVRPFPNVENPDFTGDQDEHGAGAYPDEPVRLLALFRYWNMVQYYFPSRDLMDRDWLERLPDLIPKFRYADNAADYHVAVLEMTASIDDAHASTNSPTISVVVGQRAVPVVVRLIEERTVITHVFAQLLAEGVDLRIGDVVTHIDGVPVEARRAALRPRVAGSNPGSLERGLHDRLLRTNQTHLALTIEAAGRPSITILANTVTTTAWRAAKDIPNAELAAVLPGNIGYVNMGRLQLADVDRVMEQVRNTRALVFDSRNYPNGTLYAVANYLNTAPRRFVMSTQPDYDHPGDIVWTRVFTAGPGSANAWGGTPARGSFTYAGQVVVLADQETQSQAEFTVMAFKTAPATVIGSATAGADGNVSLIRLPGGVSTYFSGLGVFYPDRSPTQRVGILPDIAIKPTIRGIREGRDEVLEAALQFLAR